jgi:3-hydroxyacyl-CoA dehydrogenase
MVRRVIVACCGAGVLGVSWALAPAAAAVEVLVLVAFAVERLRARLAPQPAYDLPVFVYRIALEARALFARHRPHHF